MKKRVLIVDDEPSIIEVIQEMIEKSDLECSCLTAKSVDEAIKIIESDRLDAIITDLVMPGRSGLDLLKAGGQREPKIPVIVISGYGDKDMISKVWKLGAAEFLDKPISSKRLLASLKNILQLENQQITPSRLETVRVTLMMEQKLLDRTKRAAAMVDKPIEQWIMDLISRSIP